MAKERIVIYFEGDLDEIAKLDSVSPDDVLDTLAHELEELRKQYGFECSYIDETYTIEDK